MALLDRKTFHSCFPCFSKILFWNSEAFFININRCFTPDKFWGHYALEKRLSFVKYKSWLVTYSTFVKFLLCWRPIIKSSSASIFFGSARITLKTRQLRLINNSKSLSPWRATSKIVQHNIFHNSLIIHP